MRASSDSCVRAPNARLPGASTDPRRPGAGGVLHHPAITQKTIAHRILRQNLPSEQALERGTHGLAPYGFTVASKVIQLSADLKLASTARCPPQPNSPDGLTRYRAAGASDAGHRDRDLRAGAAKRACSHGPDRGLTDGAFHSQYRA